MQLVSDWMDVQAGPLVTLQIIPKYRECAKILEGAWCSFTKHTCSSPNWFAAAKMKENLDDCEKLRQGKSYARSYDRLREDMATWCGTKTHKAKAHASKHEESELDHIEDEVEGDMESAEHEMEGAAGEAKREASEAEGEAEGEATAAEGDAEKAGQAAEGEAKEAEGEAEKAGEAAEGEAKELEHEAKEDGEEAKEEASQDVHEADAFGAPKE